MAASTGNYAPDKGRDKTSSTVNKLTGKAEGMVDKASGMVDDAISSVTERGREAVSGFQEVGSNIAYVVEDSAKNQPMATLAIAVGVGFVLGALWKT